MKKISDRCFCLIFLLMLLTPFLLTNFRHDQISEIDNSYLPELRWDETTPVSARISDLENYLNMRIGFRSRFLDLYQVLNDRLFGVMEHPLYTYGRDGYVYLGGFDSYQHLNLNQDYADEFAHAMRTLSDMSTKHGAAFYYMLIPDKKTVYPEHLPAGLNQFGDISLADQILHSLSEVSVQWIFLRDALVEAKQHEQVFNVKYDAGHWNDFGAFEGLCELYRRLRSDYPEIPMLTKEAYNLSMVHVSSLQVSHFAIDEDVPKYTLKVSTAIQDRDWMDENLSFPDETAYRNRYINPEKGGLPKLLVIHDSYLAGRELFFTENFSEVTFIHRYNLAEGMVLEEYLNELKPDIVVFENPVTSFGFHIDVPEAEG